MRLCTEPHMMRLPHNGAGKHPHGERSRWGKARRLKVGWVQSWYTAVSQVQNIMLGLSVETKGWD